MLKKIVHRIDTGEFRSPVITPQGYLKADALATRTGVFLYMNMDGSVRRELRTPEEVFKPDSLKTLEGVPITNDHPPEFLDSNNTARFQTGFTGDKAQQHDDFVKVGTTITDEKAVDDIMKNNKREVSCGYICELHDESGVYFGEPYDAFQKNIAYNHLSIVDMGRAGPEAKMKLEDGMRIDAQEMSKKIKVAGGNIAVMIKRCDDVLKNSALPHEKKHAKVLDDEKKDSAIKIKKGDNVMAKIKLGKVELEIEDVATAQALSGMIEEHDAMKAKLNGNDDLQKKIDELQADIDSKKDELVKKDEKIKELDESKATPEEMRKSVEDRIALETKAKEVLGEDAKFDGKTDVEIKKEVIVKVSPNQDIKDKTDDYINARYDGVIEILDEENEEGKKDGKTILNGEKVDNDDPRAKRMKKDSEKWRNPCPARVATRS